MKALITNLAKRATITALHASPSYPAQNVVDRFLDVPFVSTEDTDTLTADLGSDMTLDSIYIAGCNAASVTVTVRTAALTTVHTATIHVDRLIVADYPGAIVGRYVDISGTASGSLSFKIKGLGVGVGVDFGMVRSGFSLPVDNGSTMVRSPSGQTSSNRAPTLKMRDLSILVTKRDGGRDRVYELLDYLASLGIGCPTYWDITDDNHGFEAPLYAVIPDVWTADDNGTSFSISLSLLEAR